MTRKIREYLRPDSMAEAAALVQRPATVPADIGPRAPDAPYAGAEAVVDLSALGLGEMKQAPDGRIHLGAAVSIQSLVDSPLLQSVADGIVAEAALLSGGSVMRNAATLGGALRYARQAADGEVRDGPPELLVALMVLDAEVVVQAEAHQAVSVAEYLAPSSLMARGLVLEVRFHQPDAGAHAALARVARTPRDQAMVAAAALVSGQAVRLAVAPGGMAPLRLIGLEQRLSGQPIPSEQLEAVAAEAAAAVNPPGDFRGSAEYRPAMSGVLTRRALAQALRRAGQPK